MTAIMVCVVVVQFDFFFAIIFSVPEKTFIQVYKYFLQERFLEMQLLVLYTGFFLIGAQNWEEPFLSQIQASLH